MHTTDRGADDPCYVYGFLRTPPSELTDLVGVFGAPVRAQVDGDLAAVVSPLPSSAARASRDDVLAHSDVLQALVTHGDVLPAAFGSVYPDGFDLARLPRAERRTLTKLLDDVSGRVEYQVKATYDELGVTASLVDADSRLRRLRASRRQDYATKLALGSRFAEVLDRRRRSDAETVSKRLSRITDRVLVEPPAGEWCAFRLSLLVRRAKQDELQRALSEFADAQASYLQVEWLGPLPPYSFVQSQSRRRAS